MDITNAALLGILEICWLHKDNDLNKNEKVASMMAYTVPSAHQDIAPVSSLSGHCSSRVQDIAPWRTRDIAPQLIESTAPTVYQDMLFYHFLSRAYLL